MIRHLNSLLLRAALTTAIFVYLLRDIDWPAAVRALAGFSAIGLETFLLLIAADRVLMFARWATLMRMTTTLPLRELARIFFVSSFVGSFLPAGVGGDAARAISLARQTQRPGAAIAGVVLDRLLGLQAVAISGCLGVIAAGSLVPETLRNITLAASLLFIAVSIAALFADSFATWLLHPWRGWRAADALSALSADVSEYRRHPGILWRVAALSLLVQIVRIVLAWDIGRNLGIPLSIGYYWVFMPLNILVTLLPLSIGGFGVPQGAMVWSLAPLGVDSTPAFLLSMLFTLAGTIGNLPGAVLYIRGRTRTPRVDS